jgi:predicted RNase H-like HicB family nuclease
MRKLTYYAVFEPAKKNSYSVYWPDLPGCTSWGKTLLQAQAIAAEALALHILGIEEDGGALPEPTEPPFPRADDKSVTMPITILPDLAKDEINNNKVKTNITLPAWLKEWATQKGINLSQTLQEALKQIHDAQ